MGEQKRKSKLAKNRPASRKKKGSWVKDVLVTILAAVVLAVAIKAFVIDTRMVPTTSMVPTIEVGDRVIMSKLSYLGEDGPQRGDVIVFRAPDELNQKYDLVKRLIGLPGETVEITGGVVYIDGAALDEPYINEAPAYDYGPVTVPEGHCFVLGDNRNKSIDSHLWQDPFLDLDAIKGKAVYLYWPLDRLGKVE